MTGLLHLYVRVSAMLANIGSVEEALSARLQFKLLQDHARRVRDREVLARATVLQLKSERLLGGMLEKAKEEGRLAQKKKPKDEETDRFTLAEAGIDKKLSVVAQAAWRMPEAEFKEMIEATEARIRSRKAIIVDPVKDATKAAEIAAKRAAHAERTKGGCNVADLEQLAQSGWRAGGIGADPQWKFLAYSAAGDGRSANTHYRTEELDKIKAMPVNKIAADDCALFMWVVDWFLHGAIELMTHWGFEFKTVAFTWAKTNGDSDLDPFDDSSWHFGQGYWTRANPEMCLLGTRGAPQRLHADVRQLIVSPLGDHSVKPDAWLERIERLVAGPYIELNARRRRPGWLAYGDELQWEGPRA